MRNIIIDFDGVYQYTEYVGEFWHMLWIRGQNLCMNLAIKT